LSTHPASGSIEPSIPRHKPAQAGDEAMPIYEYECGACNHRFSETLSIRELEHHKARCPQCKSENVQRVLSQVSVKTSRKS
jgi:putative FmdB family regulatory protein